MGADIIERARHCLERDERVLAAWLEGSLATGDADEWSDVDLHIAVGDGDFENLSDDGGIRTLATSLATVLGAHRIPFGPNLVLLNATLAGPVRLDLYVERASFCAAHPRLAEPQVLFDRACVIPALRIEPEAAVVPPALQLKGLVNRYAYGFMWPARLLGRRNHTTALMNATIIAHEFLVPALLAQERPEQMHRELLSSERFLSEPSRERIETLLDTIASGYLERAADDGAALAAAHSDLVDAILVELKAACEKHEVDWPSTTEAEIRSYLRRKLDLDL